MVVLVVVATITTAVKRKRLFDIESVCVRCKQRKKCIVGRGVYVVHTFIESRCKYIHYNVGWMDKCVY